MNRVPTEKQYAVLRSLGSGAAIVTMSRRKTEPLLSRGWVTAEPAEDKYGAYYAWVRITPHGLRALADAVERYGLPDLAPKRSEAAA